MNKDEEEITATSKDLPKRNVHLYLIWVQFYGTMILFLVSINILNQSPNTNYSPQMIELSIDLTLLGLSFCFLSLIFTMLPVSILYYSKGKVEPTIELKIHKMNNILMIICAIIFVLFAVANIFGLIIYK